MKAEHEKSFPEWVFCILTALMTNS
jgi:hypothetical protein